MPEAKLKNLIKTTELVPIPDKLYFTIGEVSRICQLKTHVLRYWEKEFPQLAPSKRRGNRRYYQRKDILMIREIQNLLYGQGYTIEGARSQLNGTLSEVQTEKPTSPTLINKLVDDLEDILKSLSNFTHGA